MNMYQFLEETTAKYPDVLFLVREEQSYAQFLDMVKKRAASLHAVGIKQGNIVGVLAHNIPQFPTTLFAIWYLGATALMMDTNLVPSEYSNMVEQSKCNFVYSEKSLMFKTDKFKFIDIESVDGDINPDLKPADVESPDVAVLSFTSGSTGTPKIVPITHFNMTECANSLGDMAEWLRTGDTIYAFLPMYHVFGFGIDILATLHYGCGILLQKSFNPKDIMDDFKKYRPQVIPAVPRLWEVIRNKVIDGIKAKKKWFLVSNVLRHQKTLHKLGLGFLVRKVQAPLLEVFGGRARLLIAGGAATKPEVETFYENLGMRFIQGYGLTETVGAFCISKPIKKRVPFSFGGPTTNNEVEVRNKNADGVGVLWIRGHQVFGGYLNNPEANAEVFDDKGFFNTGDLVSVDKNGELHFEGRKKQIIVLDSGKNVYPNELEALFMEIPGVKNVCVFEYKIKNKTVSYAVFSVDDKMTMPELNSYVMHANKKIASYKRVVNFSMTTQELPMTSTQKIKHHIVRQNLIDGKYTISNN